MKLSIRNIAPLLLTLVVVLLPLVTIAAGTSDLGTPSGTSDRGTPSCNGGKCSVDNPLKVTSFCDLLKVVLQALLILGLPVAVIFLVLAGLKYVVAVGAPKKIAAAHSNLKWTIVGIAVFLGAWSIAQVIKSTLQSLGVSSFGSC